MHAARRALSFDRRRRRLVTRRIVGAAEIVVPLCPSHGVSLTARLRITSRPPTYRAADRPRRPRSADQVDTRRAIEERGPPWRRESSAPAGWSQHSVQDISHYIGSLAPARPYGKARELHSHLINHGRIPAPTYAPAAPARCRQDCAANRSFLGKPTRSHFSVVGSLDCDTSEQNGS